MRVIRCPQCNLPLLPEEAAANRCPSCGASLAEPSAPSPTAARAASARPVRGLSVAKNWQIAAAIVLPLLAVAIIARLAGSDSPEKTAPTQPVMNTANISVTEPSAVPAASLERPSGITISPSNPLPEPGQFISAKAVETPPKDELIQLIPATNTIEPKQVVQADKPTEKVEPERIDPARDGSEIKLNNPEGSYAVGSLLHQEKLKLTGQIKSLIIEGINGEAVLDASGLQAKEVIVTGAINGQAVVRVSAPEGTVDIKEQINGQAKVEINAPHGKVTVGKNATSCINGTTRLAITAKEVDLRGKVAGATRIEVTVSRGGRLKFNDLDGAAHLQYRKASPHDPDPLIQQGRVLAGAKLAKGG